MDANDPQYILFTDGACSGNPGKGGWAFILRDPATGEERCEAGAEAHTTNNRMEMTSVIRGLEALGAERRRVKLVTDSQYVIKGLSEWMAGWKSRDWMRKVGRKLEPVANEKLWRELDLLKTLHDIEFHWIRGHAGHAENERCDRMAVEAYRSL